MERIVASIWELLGNNAAEIIALCALFFTAHQAYTTRRHNRLSVKPRLATFITSDRFPGKALLSAKLINNGLGPAIIKSFQIYLDGNRLEIKSSTQMEDALKKVLHDKKLITTSATFLGKNYAMPAKESKDIVIVNFVLERDNEFEEIVSRLKFDLVVEYESIYGDKDVFDSRNKSDMN